MEPVAEELPTRDLARSRRAIVGNPSAFRSLHGKARHGVETLLVSEIRAPGQSLEAVVLNVSSGKPMPMRRVTGLAAGYSPTNACNGFLCLASGVKDWPVFVCNPAIPGGDSLWVPPPPKIERASIDWRMFAMGFSPRTGQYKLFRLSFPFPSVGARRDRNHMDVCTLGGGGGGWRRHPRLFPYDAARYGGLHSPPPVLVGGELYVLMERPDRHRAADRLLAIDVATEAHRTRRLPEYEAEVAAAHAFELRGRLCVAVHAVDRRLLRFWLDVDGGSWELLHSFYIDSDEAHGGEQPSGAWFDDGDGTLCYRLHDRLYKYDTEKKERRSMLLHVGGELSTWDQRIRLPATPSPEGQCWNVYGGYRPSLLSPRLAFGSDEESSRLLRDEQQQQEQFVHELLHAMRSQKPSSAKRRRSPDRTHGRQSAAKSARARTF